MDLWNQTDLINLLHNERFMIFMQETPYKYQHKEDFLAQPMPCNIDPEFMWELVSFQRRLTGHPSVQELSLSERKNYWSATPNVLISLNNIVSRTNLSSTLWSSLKILMKRRELLQPLVEDFSAAAFRDGLDLDYETVRALIHQDRTPSTNNEKILFDAFDIFQNSGEYVQNDFNEELFQTILKKITYGKQTDDLSPYLSPNAPDPSLFYPRTIEEKKKELAENYSNSFAWGIHPLFGSLMSSDIIWEERPFEPLNGLMEVILRSIALSKIGIPALSFVPLSKIRLNWEQGIISPPQVPFPYGKAIVESSFGIDSTPYLQQITAFLEEGLEKLESLVSKAEEQVNQQKSLISEDCRLNHRQKQLLVEMIDDPELTIDIGEFQDYFEVAGSTAREDLLKLISLNFLSSEFQGKKQVFWARPDREKAFKAP